MQRAPLHKKSSSSQRGHQDFTPPGPGSARGAGGHAKFPEFDCQEYCSVALVLRSPEWSHLSRCPDALRKCITAEAWSFLAGGQSCAADLATGVACGLGVRIARTVVDEAPALEPLMSSLPLAPEAFARPGPRISQLPMATTPYESCGLCCEGDVAVLTRTKRSDGVATERLDSATRQRKCRLGPRP